MKTPYTLVSLQRKPSRPRQFARCARVLLFAVPLLANAATPPSAPAFQIVESVPEATIYGEPGVPRTQAVWLDMIRGARKRIDIAAFYIAEKPGGGVLGPVLDALTARAEAGVDVRILVDQTFLKDNHADVDRLRQLRGITLRVLPVNTLTGGVLHAKFMIVDNISVFLGSQNWDWRALEQIHEIRSAHQRRAFRPDFHRGVRFQLATGRASRSA